MAKAPDPFNSLPQEFVVASSCGSVLPSKSRSKFHISFAARNFALTATVLCLFTCGAFAQQQIAEALPLTLAQAQITDATQKAADQPMIPVVQPRRPSVIPSSTDHGVCYTPGSPETPDVVIPGTPAIGDSPGTPSTVIPGTPPTPPRPYRCP
jgi:hypothetical protein